MTGAIPRAGGRRSRAGAVALGLLLLAWPGGARGAEPGEGREVLDRARELARTTRHWSDRRQTLTLRIVDERGNTRERKLAMLTRREGPGEEKSLAVFLEPADVRGTSFLQHVPRGGASSQWLYLPELGRVRQINAQGRRKSFMGTDFSYADLDLIENALHWTDEEAAARRIDDERKDAAARSAWFELRPRSDGHDYERVVLRLSEDDAVLRAMEMYDAGAEPEKVLLFEDVEEIGGIPTARRLEMSRPDRGTRTIVALDDVRYDSGIAESAFTRRAVERGLDYVE